MKHAKLSPSSSARWLNCPGSVEACKDIPFGPSEAAAEGTHAHRVAELVLRNTLGTEDDFDSKLLALETEAAPEIWPLMLSGADLYARTVAERLQPGAKVAIEEKLDIVGDNCFGTADFVGLSDGRLIVVDYKFGRGRVTAEGNTQMLLYAIGAMNRVGDAVDSLVDSVELVIVQPKLEPSVSTHTYSRDWVQCWKEMIAEPAVAEAVKPNAKLVASEGACRWCPAKATCPEIERVILQGFDDYEERGMTKHTIGIAFLASDWAKAVIDEATAFINDGGTIEGYQVAADSYRTALKVGLPELKEHYARYGLDTALCVQEKPLALSAIKKHAPAGVPVPEFLDGITEERPWGVKLRSV